MSKEHIRFSVENSLANLGTDYLDLLLIHRPNPFMDFEQTAIALDKMVEKKGEECWSIQFYNCRVDNFNSFLKNKIVTNQIEASVLHLEPFHDGSIAQCQRHAITPMAWSPLEVDVCSQRRMSSTRVLKVLRS